MVISVGCKRKGLSSFLGGQSVHRLNIFDIVIFFGGNSQRGCRLLAVFAEELHYLSALSQEVSITGVTQGNRELLPSPNSPDLHQTQIQ